MNEHELFDKFASDHKVMCPPGSPQLELARYAFFYAVHNHAKIDPAPPPQVVRGEGTGRDEDWDGFTSATMVNGVTLTEYQANSEKLAGLVDTYIGPDGLRGTTPHQAVEEIRRLAALLAPKGKTS